MSVVEHPVLEEAEVAADEGEVRFAFHLFGILQGILVLVEAVEMSCALKAPEYLPAVAAATECEVHIYAAGLDVKSINCLFQQYRHMIFLTPREHYNILLYYVLSSFIISSKMLPTFSGSLSRPSAACLLQISMVSSTPMKRTSLLMPACSM